MESMVNDWIMDRLILLKNKFAVSCYIYGNITKELCKQKLIKVNQLITERFIYLNGRNS